VLLNELKKGALHYSYHNLQRLISGGYVSDEEIGKRPLSKLVRDVSEELGVVEVVKICIALHKVVRYSCNAIHVV
jgi:hypothetical protein